MKLPFYYKDQIISGGGSGAEIKVIPLTLYGKRWDMVELGGQFVDWPSEINMDFANQIVIPYPALPVSNVDSYYAADIRLSPKNLNGKMFFTGGHVDTDVDIPINLYVFNIDDPNGCVFNINPVNNADYIRSVDYKDLWSDDRILYLKHPIRPMTKEYYDAAIGNGMDFNNVVCLITDGPYIIYNGEVMFGSQPSGSSVPAGGTTNQVLTKVTDKDGDVEWRDGGIPQEAADERYLKLTGGTLTGNLRLEDGTGEVDLDVANGHYTFAQDGVSTIIGKSSDVNWGNIVGGVAEPRYDYDAANKKYVDSAISNARCFAVQAAAPADTKLLWIDTNASTGGLKYYNGSAWVHVPVAWG